MARVTDEGAIVAFISFEREQNAEASQRTGEVSASSADLILSVLCDLKTQNTRITTAGMSDAKRLPTSDFNAVLMLAAWSQSVAHPADISLLVMGDNGHHRPEARFQELAPALAKRGIDLKYTDQMEDLTADTLAGFDGLVLYANIDRIEDAQAKAVLDYVAGGKGFVPLYCATYCWRNNNEIVALMGGQFQRHGVQEELSF